MQEQEFVAPFLLPVLSASCSCLLLLLLFLSAGPRLRSFCRRRRTIVNEAHPTNHHLFPRLVAPLHRLGRIRVVLIVSGVVKMRNALDPGSFGNRNWIFKYVIRLPTEIVARHRQQDLRSAIWKHSFVLKILSAKMHVRHEAIELR